MLAFFSQADCRLQFLVRIYQPGHYHKSAPCFAADIAVFCRAGGKRQNLVIDRIYLYIVKEFRARFALTDKRIDLVVDHLDISEFGIGIHHRKNFPNHIFFSGGEKDIRVRRRKSSSVNRQQLGKTRPLGSSWLTAVLCP